MMNEYIATFTTFKPNIVKAFYETMDMMFTSMTISLFVGLLLGFVLFTTGSNGIYKNKIVYFIVSSAVNMIRSIPFILFIIVLIPFSRMLLGTGFGVDSSKIPLSLIGTATFARFSEKDMLDVDKNIYETSYALGASPIQYFTEFLLREARTGLVLSFASTTISLLSYSTVMGIIGGGGLGYLAMNEGYYNFNYNLMWLIIVMMILIVQTVQTLGNGIAKKIDK